MEILNYAGNILHYAISFVVILSIIVFIHEFGHFWVARRCGVKVDEFSIGFGKKLFGWVDKKGTLWKISLLPFGGFVKMHGDASEASNPDTEKLQAMSEEERKISFYHKPLWQKALVVAAGPMANFILSFVILTGLAMVFGKIQFDAPPVVNEVIAGSAAEKAGIKSGDEVVSIDGVAVKSFAEIPKAIAEKAEQNVVLVVKRKGETMEINVVPGVRVVDDAKANKVKLGSLGITSPSNTLVESSSEPMGIIEAAKTAVEQVYVQCYGMLKGLKQIITGTRSSKELGGPLKIMEYSGQSTNKISEALACVVSAEGKDCGKIARDGLIVALLFMTVISTMLGLVNLFPIPMLDGGHLLFYAIEAVSRRKAPEKIQEWSFRAGFAFIICLMLYVTYNDIMGFINKFVNS